MTSSLFSCPLNRTRFLITATCRDLDRSLRLHFSHLLASDENQVVPDWSDPRDVQEALSVCHGVLLIASGAGDDVMNRPLDATNEWLQCEQKVASLVAKDHRVVKLSWTEGFERETSFSTVGRATWAVEEELKLRVGGGHKLTILRATMGMDAFLRGQLFNLICGRTLSTSIKRGRIAFVHPLDVAESLSAVVAKMESGGQEEGGLFKLTGPEALTFPDVAKLLSRGIGDKVTYSHFPLWAVQPARWVQGVPGDAVEEELAVIRALEAGVQQQVDTSFMETLLGHKPRSLRTFIAENAGAWPRTHPV